MNSDFMVKIGHDQLCVDVSLDAYSKAALFRACYVFTDRCYLFLSPRTGNKLSVFIKPKTGFIDLKAIVGDFCNELIDQQIRQDLIKETGEIRNMIVAQAFAEGDLLDEKRDQSEYLEDPLNI